MRRPAHFAIPLTVVLLLQAGCSSGGLTSTDDASDSQLETGGPIDTDSSTDTPDALWAGLSGTVILTGGVGELASSSLTWSFYDGNMLSLCTYTAPLSALTDLTPPDPELLSWWQVATDDSDDDLSCIQPRPAALEFGFGPLDPQLYPALSNGDYDDNAAPYGLYTKVGWDAIDTDTPLWVFGVAGTTGAFDGSEPAQETGPLVDGTYTLEPLHLFRVP